MSTGPEWPGIPSARGEEHGQITQMDCPEWLAPRFCASCGGYHAKSYTGCNGLRDFEEARCWELLGEGQCVRPARHLGRHIIDSDALRVEWYRK